MRWASRAPTRLGSARDHHPPAAVHRLDGLGGHRLGRHPHEPRQRAVGDLDIEAHGLREARLHRPRAQDRDGDASPPDLLGHGLRVGEHEGLAGAVAGLAGDGLERGGGGHVEDGAPAPLDHAWQERAAEVGDGLDIGAQHRHLAIGGALVHRPHRREAGVVHEHVDGEAARGHLGDQCIAGVLVGEVGGEHLGAHAVRAGQLLGQGDQRRLPAGHQGDAVSPGGELASEVDADAGRRAGDQAGATGAGTGRLMAGA